MTPKLALDTRTVDPDQNIGRVKDKRSSQVFQILLLKSVCQTKKAEKNFIRRRHLTTFADPIKHPSPLLNPSVFTNCISYFVQILILILWPRFNVITLTDVLIRITSNWNFQSSCVSYFVVEMGTEI